MKDAHIYSEARTALRAQDSFALMEKAAELINSEHEPSHAAGYLIRGGIYEYGGVGVVRDLDKAILDYRKALLLVDSDITNWYLGRALLKSGSYIQAQKFLQAACGKPHLPDVDVDMGRLYERGPMEDLCLSLMHFRNAAIKGRVQGIRGCIRVLIKRGSGRDKLNASILAIGYILSIPIIRIIFGKKAFSAY